MDIVLDNRNNNQAADDKANWHIKIERQRSGCGI
jgi:hypothetical protein